MTPIHRPMSDREREILNEFRAAERAADERLQKECARHQQEYNKVIKRAADHMNARLEELPVSFVPGKIYQDADGQVWYYNPVAVALNDPKPWRLLVAMNVDAAGRSYGEGAPRRPLREMVPGEEAAK